MTPLRTIALLAVCLLPAMAAAQLRMGPRLSPGGLEVLDPPATAADVLAPPNRTVAAPGDVLTAAPSPVARGGQQHWVSLNLSSLQPTTGRLGVKVWDRPNGSLWLEVYGGSVLVDAMYGFGARMQFTLKEFAGGDQVMVAPGLGAHIVPHWRATTRRWPHPNEDHYWGYYGYVEEYRSNSLSFLVGDVDISWLHDFSPHFGFELGVKLGLAGRVGGEVGRSYPRGLMFGRDFYPVVSFFLGFRL